MVNYKEYYEGKGDGFFQVPTMVSLVSICMHVVRLYTKNAPTMH